MEPAPDGRKDCRRHRFEPLVSGVEERNVVVRDRSSSAGNDRSRGKSVGRRAGGGVKMATPEIAISKTIGKVRPHQTQNEGLVFEKSSPGKKAYKLPPLDVPEVDASQLLG